MDGKSTGLEVERERESTSFLKKLFIPHLFSRLVPSTYIRIEFHTRQLAKVITSTFVVGQLDTDAVPDTNQCNRLLRCPSLDLGTRRLGLKRNRKARKR